MLECAHKQEIITSSAHNAACTSKHIMIRTHLQFAQDCEHMHMFTDPNTHVRTCSHTHSFAIVGGNKGHFAGRVFALSA